MPVHMESLDVATDLEKFKSVLIVSCPVCPPISLATQTKTPFIELFKRGIKTGAFEEYITSLREPLEQRGVRTDAYKTYIPSPTMCLWTKGQRNRFLKRAKDYEAVVVLGCDTATYTVKDAVQETNCQVIQGMRSTGFTNARLRFRLPMTVELE